jgi:glyoxylate/hydroxypyruvate reductase
MSGRGRVTVLIASPLEPEHVVRVAEVDRQRIRVIFEPDLLPVPRYEGDHEGAPRSLDAGGLARWKALLAEADVMFDFDWLEPRTLPDRAPRLRWLQATSAGIGEMLERNGLLASGIHFTTAAGVHAAALSEFVVLGLLYWTKNVPLLQMRQAERHWERYTAESLAGRRVLVVGLGRVGSAIARACDALGMDVWGMRRRTTGNRPPGVRRLVALSGLRDALGEVDALVLACPLTRETHHLIGAEELEALPDSAIFVNVARGAVVDQSALTWALVQGTIRGAVLDVFEREPLPVHDPVWSLPTVLVSPHSASTVRGENARIAEIFVQNLHRYLGGLPLENEFDAERGY